MARPMVGYSPMSRATSGRSITSNRVFVFAVRRILQNGAGGYVFYFCGESQQPQLRGLYIAKQR